MTATAVYLLRHGRTASNASGTWQGQADVPLDDVGRHEATLAGQALRDLAPARVITSDLVRAAETARALGAVVGARARARPAAARGRGRPVGGPDPHRDRGALA